MSTTQTARSEDILYALGFDDGYQAGHKLNSGHDAFQAGYEVGRGDTEKVWEKLKAASDEAEKWKARYESCNECLKSVAVVTLIAFAIAFWGWLR
jgi:hypothetical protein